MTDPIINQLICGGAGLAGALVAGHFGTGWFHEFLERSADLGRRSDEKRVPAWITGGFERLLTFGLVVSDFPGFQNVILAWLAAKLAANWQRAEPVNSSDSERQEYRTRAQIALMAGVVSIAFAYFGGMIAKA